MTMNSAQPKNHWNAQGRSIVFALASASIACLLLDFYHLCPMQTFALWVLLPATIALVILALLDLVKGDRQLWRAVVIGIVAGLLAAVSYDIFRLPFVFAREWGIDSIVPPLKLFKVFPRFGAMILGEPIEQSHYSMAAQIIGWAYHFSNGATFGAMYLAMIGNGARRHWAWGVAMSVGLELGMLLTPYPGVFGIHLSALFVAVTLAAHLIFGIVMGLFVKWFSNRWRVQPATVAA